jgi:hypothetical protein
MKKTAVYSWRVSPERKTALEREARREGTTVGGLLERLTREWIDSRQPADGDAEQARLHTRAHRTLGQIAGHDPHRAERARTAIRARIRRRHGR